MDNLFDDRLYRILSVDSVITTSSSSVDKQGNQILSTTTTYDRSSQMIKPLLHTGTYVYDYLGSPGSIIKSALDTIDSVADADKEEELQNAKTRANALFNRAKVFSNQYVAGQSVIHPYALLRLEGSKIVSRSDGTYTNVIDSADTTRWYETMDMDHSSNTNLTEEYDSLEANYDYGDDGLTPITFKGFRTVTKTRVKGNLSNSTKYAKDPTTADLIWWSRQDPRGRFPYAFQDFVFCKHWNKISNNRLITLRRYPSPVTDNVEPARYVGSESAADAITGKIAEDSNKPYSPLVSAVTYFGEGTDNVLSDMLAFGVKYNWEDMSADVYQTSSQQIKEGHIFNNSVPYLNTGISALAIGMGLLGDLKGVNKISPEHAIGLPPDPYDNGPYENRIFGPVNVVTDTYKRGRGLKFTSDGLVVTFSYVSRPIAGINNKAILLDLLANILAMSYSSGAFFGGAHRYRQENPAIYPWRNMDAMNKIYHGRLFGKSGGFQSLLSEAFNASNGNWIWNFAKSVVDGVKQLANDLINAVVGGSKAEAGSQEASEAEENREALTQVSSTVGRAVAAKMLKGAQAPWLQGAKALLTGEPIGDWHLTIGNPLNPIATIGNLIVTDCNITFSDELGPDDFPIGFTAKITLAHGMARDKDSVESMFNKGAGRIYILPDGFVSSADHETCVDAYTGVERNKYEGEFKANGGYGVLRTTGSYDVSGKLSTASWRNSTVNIQRGNLPSVALFKTGAANVGTEQEAFNQFVTEPWAMRKIL